MNYVEVGVSFLLASIVHGYDHEYGFYRCRYAFQVGHAGGKKVRWWLGLKRIEAPNRVCIRERGGAGLCVYTNSPLALKVT